MYFKKIPKKWKTCFQVEMTNKVPHRKCLDTYQRMVLQNFRTSQKREEEGKKQVIHKKLTIRVATSQQQGWKLEIVDFWTM